MRKLFSLAAACCLMTFACFAGNGVAHANSFNQLSDSLQAKANRTTLTLQIVHNGSPLRTITSLTINGVAVSIPAGYAYSTVATVPSGLNTVVVTYSDIAATECFNAYVITYEHRNIYNMNYHGVNTATFTVDLPATDTYPYLQLLDNIGCSN